jgi:cysteine desulfurase / selenocysteine lyase
MVAAAPPAKPGHPRVLEALDPSELRRREFPAATGRPYLNAASVTPLPERSRRAIEEHGRRRSDPESLRGDDFEPTLARARRAAARIVAGGEDEIALLPSTSFGIHLAAHALPLEAGRRVVLHDLEFPANVHPWLALERTRGARAVILPNTAAGRPDEARMLEEVERGGVGIAAVSAVRFTDGWVADLAALGAACERAGTWLVVDGIQALGQLPLDPRALGVHVLACGGHKWLCSPFGTGFAWVRRELVERLEPPVVGWSSLRSCADLEHVTDYRAGWVDGARRFEVGTLPFGDYAGMAASLELLADVDPRRIAEHLASLLEPLVPWLEDRGAGVRSDRTPARRSGILALRPPDLEGVHRRLVDAGIGCALREGALRLAPHLYNDSAEIERLMEVLDGALPR